MMGGSALAYRTYQQNRATQVWMPLTINPDLPAERTDQTVNMLRQKLSEHVLLVQVSKDVGLAKKLKLASDDAAASELGKRLFVEVGKADSPLGKVPSLNIGFNCKVKEFRTMSDCVNRLSKDVLSLLGIAEPKKQGL